MDAFIDALPKCELHLHIEGTLEPELLFALAARHSVALPYPSVAAARAAYRFTSLQSFLDLYYTAFTVLKTRADFTDLAAAYFARAKADHITHAELAFDGPAHERNGVAISDVVLGLVDACNTAKATLGITSRLIFSFQRDYPLPELFASLQRLAPLAHHIAAVGLDSAEIGYPAAAFEALFAAARAPPYNIPHAVAHAGEEGGASEVLDAMRLLKVSRVDHGVAAAKDVGVVDEVVRRGVALTVCPLSNVRLGVVGELGEVPVGRLLDLGVKVTVNSDDPAYFGGYLGENLRAVAGEAGMTRERVYAVVRNAFEASFLEEGEKREKMEELRRAAVEAGL